MNRKILSTKIATTILLGVLLLFNLPSLAQVTSQVIPRIEVIEDSEGIPPSYRLVISRPQDNVDVLCPTGFEPKLDYLRGVEAIQCSSQVIPRIEVIESYEEISPSYRLVINQSQDIVYVSCPTGFEPQLDYLRNVQTIQCQPYTSPQQ
ncbi:hypothetical protein IQ265_13260 [Nodosilinea sp. LEGE 06152]|uniref:hypothetical protein n=1 Tax=Nodosilinea sp. LEGE 06152 TaxID=2777966 RepID=UPI0018801532|nr:hypothetical protein [Nodosilinea sp. LEGE 06152]MBE9157785.1 hypothetical protein [Nodosilinea sp. LEGE 06152]